jgi:predicted small lipoprotein YifL
MHKISSTFLLLLSLITIVLLSACGSKGDLYQTSADEVVINEKNSNDARNENEANTEKLN